MSNNPYVQVAMTYVRRPFSSQQNVLMAIVLFGMMVACCVDRNAHGSPMLFMGAAFLFRRLASHIKEQFTDSRAYLTPDFGRIHVAVATVAIVLAAIFLPAMLTALMGAISIGLVAIMVFLFSLILWAVVLHSIWLCWFIIGGLLLGFVGPINRELNQLISGQFEIGAAFLLITGAVITTFALRWLMQLNEDIPAYRTRIQWDCPETNAMPRQTWTGEGRLFPKLWDWMTERQVTSVSRHASRASVSWWSRICRWQIGMVTGWSVWFWILCAVVYVHILTRWGKAPGSSESMTFVAIIPIFLPTVAIMSVIQRRSSMFERELLMPVDRKSYIRQLGTAAALSQFLLWGGISIAMALWYWLSNADLQPQQLSKLAVVLVFSGAFQVGFFGIQAWIAQYRSYRLNSVIMGILIGVAQIPLFRLLSRSSSTTCQLVHETMWIASSIVLVGLLITFDAYRRWLKTDFG